MKRIEFQAMGSHMLALVDAAGSAPLLDRVPSWFEEWEQALSRFRPDSELSRLNRSAGNLVPVSPTLWEVFHAARKMESWTGGLVRPTLLEAVAAAGYDRSFDRLVEEALAPLDGSILQLGAAVAVLEEVDISTAVGWDEATRSLALPEGVHLDFGGIAKGWAARMAVERLAEAGPALVDAGGDIAVSGPRRDGSPWPVGVRDPFRSGRHFEILRITDGGVATSGTDYHRWLQDGQLRHHIIDPRSGHPAATDVLTATVLAPDSIRAEAAAKAALILGCGAGLAWLEADPDLAGILVLETGQVLYSKKMESYLCSTVVEQS